MRGKNLNQLSQQSKNQAVHLRVGIEMVCFIRLWKDVTLNLKLKDIDAATEAKHRLEEKQRAEARERKEKEQQWETRVSLSLRCPSALMLVTMGNTSPDSVFLQLFHEDGECWVYDEPLLKRLVSQRP